MNIRPLNRYVPLQLLTDFHKQDDWMIPGAGFEARVGGYLYNWYLVMI